MKQLTKKFRILTCAMIAVLIMALLPVGALAESYSAVVTEKSVKVYSDSTLDTYAGALKRGEVVVVEAVSGQVAQVTYKGVTGYYCSIAALTDVMEVGKPVIVNTDTRAYEKANTNSKSINIARGTELTLLAAEGAWALVEGNGYGLYINKAHLSLIDEELSTPEPTVKPSFGDDIEGSIACTVTATTLNVYEATSTASSKLMVLEYGDEVQVIAYNSSWAYLYCDGVYGYCATSGLIKTSLIPSETPEETPDSEDSFEAIVTVKSQAYATADTNSQKLAMLPVGTVVNVLDYNATWAKVELNGSVGYVKTNTLKRADDVSDSADKDDDLTGVNAFTAIAIVNASVYSGADDGSSQLGIVSAGDTVKVQAYNSTWTKVEVGGVIGYVATKNLIKYELKECNPYKASIVTKAQAYAAPSTSAAKMSMLPKGTEVKVTAYSADWAKVEKNGAVGYVKMSAVEKIAPANLAEEYREKYPAAKFSATVIYPSAPGYYDKDTSSADFKLNIATQVDVYAYSKNWAYIGIGDSRGFIATKYLSTAEYTELSDGSNGENTKKLQQSLLTLGYYDGQSDGNYSTLTTLAVRRFQEAIGVNQTGVADVHTLRVLYGGYAPACSLISATLSSGSTGEHVTRIQTRLYYLDYFSKAASIDGSYGNTTIAAVKLFQGAAGVSVTGNVDAATMAALYADKAPTLPRGNLAADYVPSSSSNPEVLKIPKGLESTQSYLPDNATRDEKIEYVIYIAQQQLGKPYIYGTAGPNSFDCSGFTTYCYKKISVSLGRSAYAQGYNSSSGTKIGSMDGLKRGDLVCFDTITDSDISDHVGIYLGSGYFIHASSGTGNGRQVCISNLNTGYYTRVFSWGRRPLD